MCTHFVHAPKIVPPKPRAINYHAIRPPFKNLCVHRQKMRRRGSGRTSRRGGSIYIHTYAFNRRYKYGASTQMSLTDGELLASALSNALADRMGPGPQSPRDVIASTQGAVWQHQVMAATHSLPYSTNAVCRSCMKFTVLFPHSHTYTYVGRVHGTVWF